MAKRHHNAIAIQQGACNPSGIAHSIVDACQEIRAEPTYAGTAQLVADPAIRLMVHQLAHICGCYIMDNSLDAYSKVMAECRSHLTPTTEKDHAREN